MGKLSFRYRMEPEPGHMNAFRYKYENLTEYGLAYQRYAALSDASIFNSPVGITKIAAGLSDLRALFMVTKRNEFSIKDDGNSVRHREAMAPQDAFMDITKSGKNIDNIRKPGMVMPNRYNYMDILKETYASGDKYLTGNAFDTMFAYGDLPSFTILPMFMMEYPWDITGNDIGTMVIWRDVNHMEIRRDIIVDGEANHMEILKDIMTLPDTSDMQILSDTILSGEENHGDYYDFSAVIPPKITPKLYENLYARIPRPSFNILEDIFGWMPDPGFNILYQPEIFKALPNGIINQVENAAKEQPAPILNETLPIPHREIIVNYPYMPTSFRIDKYANKFATIIMNIGDKVVNRIEMEICSKPMPPTNINETLIISVDGKRILENEFLRIPATGKVINLNECIFGSGEKNKSINDMNQLFFGAAAAEKVGYFFNPDTFGIQETKYTVYVTDVHGNKIDLHAYTDDYYIFSNKAYNMETVRFDEVDAGVLNKYADVYSAVSASKDIEHAIADNSGIHAKGGIKHVFTSRTFVPLKYGKSGRNASMYSNVFLSRDNMMAMYFNKGIFSIKLNTGLRLEDSGIHVFKDFTSRGLFLDYYNEFASDGKRGMFLHQEPSSVFKVSKDMNIFDKNVFAGKFDYRMFLGDNGYFIYRLPYDLMMSNQNLQAFRESYDVERFAKGIWTSNDKTSYHISTNLEIKDTAEFVFRTIRHAQVSNIIVPFSRINRKGTVNDINTMVFRTMRSGDWAISQDMWASVMPKPAWYDSEELFIDKDNMRAYIDYQNEWLTKIKLKGMIADGLLGVFKDKRQSCTFRNEWVSKDRIYGTIYEPSVDAFKAPKNTHVFEDEWLKRLSSMAGAYVFEDEWVNKEPSLCYYAYELMADKDKTRNTNIFKDEWVEKEKYKAVADFGSPVTRDANIRIWIDEYIFTERGIKNFDVYESLEWLEKTRKKLGLHPNDIGNWAWVYETPDPIQPVFGIDELLLPENDTAYEDLKEIIFDKEKMRPRNPVKIIDDTTFIAKYPIRHPSKDHFKDLAIDYDASAYKWENYYGIKTEVMYICFLKYYRIWEAKMFEFSTMTMQQSVNQMLEYMYAWMIDYFPLEELEQAFRVLRLIRWYGETAIIQNSQYLISYEYGILESKLTGGTCLVPNDLNTNDSMFVDAAMGVIRNNPAYIRTGPAYVEFYIDNKKNTTFTFSLSNTVGSVNIYINDVLVDQRPFTAMNLTYPLNATGETNVVRIEKPAAHNLNDIFYIGNIKVPDCGFKDLNIEFDPKIRAGNKPLDVVAKKMVQFAQLHENRDNVYDMIFKANFGINEVYKKLLEYWELHHADKVKGKRLTIKKC